MKAMVMGLVGLLITALTWPAGLVACGLLGHRIRRRGS
jgi:hypothetical protein